MASPSADCNRRLLSSWLSHATCGPPLLLTSEILRRVTSAKSRSRPRPSLPPISNNALDRRGRESACRKGAEEPSGKGTKQAREARKGFLHAGLCVLTSLNEVVFVSALVLWAALTVPRFHRFHPARCLLPTESKSSRIVRRPQFAGNNYHSPGTVWLYEPQPYPLEARTRTTRRPVTSGK